VGLPACGVLRYLDEELCLRLVIDSGEPRSNVFNGQLDL